MTLQQLLSQCCGSALNSSRLRTLLTLLLQKLYEDPNNHEASFAEALKCLKFDPDKSSKGGFQIGPSHSVHKDTDIFIRVAVRRVEIQKNFLGDYGGSTEDGKSDMMVKRQTATITLRHSHPDADIALLMAESSMTFLEAMKRHLLSSVPGLLSLECIELGEVTTSRPEPILREIVDLTLRMEYQLLISVSEESHLLKNFGLTFFAN